MFATGLFGLMFVFVLGGDVFAQPIADDPNLQLEGFGEASGLSDEPLTLIIARMIRNFMALLGIGAVGFIVYAGWLWMTAGGNVEKVAEAKKVMINATIGMAIILSSFAIASFIIGALVNSITPSGGTTGDGSGGGPGGGGPLGGGNAMIVQLPNSTQAGFIDTFELFFFKNLNQPIAVDLDSITLGQTLTLKQNGAEIDVDVVSDANMLLLKVKDTDAFPCPENSKNKTHCFANDGTFEIELSDGFAGIVAVDGSALECTNAFPCTKTWTIGHIDDSTAPTGKIDYLLDTVNGLKFVYSGDAAAIDTSFDGQASATDDLEVSKVHIMPDNKSSFYVQVDVEDGEFPPASALFPFSHDTNGLKALESHHIKMEMFDTSQNVGEGAEFFYTTVALHCVNSKFEKIHDDFPDEDETGLDCGGASCLACSADTCESDSDCASGVCGPAGTCVDSPVITGVFSNNGAKGNYVTIVGKGFGPVNPGSTVTFTGAAGSKGAVVVQCTKPPTIEWSDTEIIVKVPDLPQAKDYVIRVTRFNGTFDTTDALPGPALPDFEINGIERPGIACVNPDSDITFGSAIDVYGTNFGGSQVVGSTLKVGPISVAPNSWSNTKIASSVPSVTAGEQSVVVTASGQQSNPVTIVVTGLNEENSPVIGSVFPADAKRGDMITIVGNGFGDDVGVVYFGDDKKLADMDLPPQCVATDAWTNKSIIVKVPVDISFGSQPIRVERISPVAESAPHNYVIEEGLAGPNLCSIDPDNGPIGTLVSLVGEKFGDTAGSVEIGSKAAGSGSDWGDGEIMNVAVPGGALTGDVYVFNSGDPAGKSNPVIFEVNDCQVNGCSNKSDVCCAAGSKQGSCVATAAACLGEETAVTAAYEWIFSTGKVPVIPSLVNQCGEGLLPSPAPSAERNGGNDVCVNAAVTGVFNIMVQDVSYGSDIVVEACGEAAEPELDEDGQPIPVEDVACPSPTKVAGKIEMEDSGTSFTFSPTSDLNAGTLHRVTLSNSIVSDPDEGDPIHMAKNASCEAVVGLAGDPSACFVFTTTKESEQCAVKSVLVNPGFHQTNNMGPVFEDPDEEIATELFTFAAHGFGEDACVALNTNGNAWQWTTEGPFASHAQVNPFGGELSHTSGVTAVEALPQDNYVEVQAEYTNPDASTAKGFSELYITQEDPYVTTFSPHCDKACVNGQISFSFNTLMQVPSVQPNVGVYPCYDETCKALKVEDKIVLSYGIPDMQQIKLASGATMPSASTFELIPFNPKQLSPSTWYKVIINGGDSGVKSLFGLSLSLPNDGDNYSWKFRTRDDGIPCTVTDVDMVPVSGTVNAQGQTLSYKATPKTEGDECDPDGQKLNAWSYDWDWSTEDVDVAVIVSGGVDAGATQPWCSADGFLTGSSALDAVCGDGNVINDYEDCDDGNIENGDGCSSSCLHEGVPTEENDDGEIVSTDACGDADVTAGAPDYISSINNIWIDDNEECDDGNLNDNDGCSSECLNEGSSAAGSVCGNGDVGPGEDCDDGNSGAGDGCSGQCLYEGSPQLNPDCATLTEFSPNELIQACAGNVYYAVCGNGVVEDGEACDDGNVDGGDGCGSNCLYENLEAGQNTCEPVVNTDDKVDPVQSVEAVGAGEVNSDLLQITIINAVPDGSTVEGEAEFALQCGYQPQENCAASINKSESLYGVASNSCCLLRPQVDFAYPEGTNICLNTAIFVDVSKELASESLAGNVHLYEQNCDAGETPIYLADAATAASAPWYARAWRSVEVFAVKMLYSVAYADEDSQPFPGSKSFCKSDITGTITTAPIADYTKTLADGTEVAVQGGTRVYFNITELLAKDTDYVLVLDGGDDGVMAQDGVAMNSGANHIGDWFSTTTETDEPCVIDHVEVDPSDVLLDGFDAASAHIDGQALTKNGAQVIEIPGVYSWEWDWSIPKEKPEGVVVFGEVAEETARDIKTNSINGKATVAAEVTVVEDTVAGTLGNTYDDTAQIEVFICENPWPAPISTGDGFSMLPDGFSDGGYVAGMHDGFELDQKVAFGDDFDLGSLRTNFAFRYCRDQGLAQNVYDDLPALEPLVITDPPNPDSTLKEFFFSPDVPGNKDVIGIRVEKNAAHLPLKRWYDVQGFAGTPSQTLVAGFPALQDGRTMYISGVNAENANDDEYNINKARTNVYVLSYNQGAQPATLAIFQQIIENFQLMVNVKETGSTCFYDSDVSGLQFQRDYNGEEQYVHVNGERVACFSDLECVSFPPPTDAYTTRCSDVQTKLIRDLRRLADLGTISDSLDTYYDQNQIYPTLSSGTFIPGKTTSAWGSWQSNLGNNLGAALPVDPLNKFAACGDEAAEQETCWNQLEQTFDCPAGSHVYDYTMTAGGQSYILRNDFELPPDLWMDFAITEPKWQLENSCTGATLGAASISVCGNGLIEGGEECDPPGSLKQEDQNVGGGEIETILFQCTDSCQWTSKSSITYAACGNGVVDSAFFEECDDGEKNGTYGFCNNECSGTMGCGDGTVQSFPNGPEVCEVGKCSELAAHSCTTLTDCEFIYDDPDDATDQIKEACGDPTSFLVTNLALDADDEDAIKTKYKYSCGSCEKGTVWAQSKSNSCNWDCREFGPYCGDGIVNGPEECDGTVGVPEPEPGPGCKAEGLGTHWQQLCSSTCKIEGGECMSPGSSSGGGDVEEAIEGCGNGEVEPDKGEECDLGEQNALTCVAPYGNPSKTCTFCHEKSCKLESASGPFCGDDTLNGGEECDLTVVKGGAAKACIDLGYDFGIPLCNNACTGYTEEGCQYCGVVVKDEGDSSTYSVSGIALDPTKIKPEERGIENADVFLTYGGPTENPKNADQISNEFKTDNAGAYAFDIGEGLLDDGTPACTEYGVSVAKLGYQSSQSSTFSGNGSPRLFTHFFIPQSFKHPTFFFVVEWPKTLKNLDASLLIFGQDSTSPYVNKQTPLEDAPQFMQQKYANDPAICAGEIGLPSSPFAPLSCHEYDGKYASLLYDNNGAQFGYEVFALVNPDGGDDILIGNQTTIFTVYLQDADESGKMYPNASQIKLHVYNENGEKVLTRHGAAALGVNSAKISIMSADSVTFLPTSQ